MQDLSLHILDIVENSIASGADSISVKVSENYFTNEISISIIDNGKGMDMILTNCVCNPFVTTRKERAVGLGISLFKERCELADGFFGIVSEKNVGTKIHAVLKANSLNAIPLGKIQDTICAIFLERSIVNFSYEHEIICAQNDEAKRFSLTSGEIRAELCGEIPISSPCVVEFVCEYIEQREKLLSVYKNRAENFYFE